MFPLSHTYVIGRLVPSLEPLHILGAIFPDAVLINNLGWEQTHQAGAALYAYLAECAPAGLPFAVGVISHGVTPPGLDYYGDQKYGGSKRGYAFEEARPYAGRVAAICHLPASMGLWKAHNFVEMAIEWLLAQQNPRLGEQVQEAFGDAGSGATALSARLAQLAPHVGAFFGRPNLDLGAGLAAMLPFLALEQVSPQALAERYQRQVHLKHGVEAIDVAAGAALIEEVAAAIQPRCWEFMADVLRKISAMLKREGWVA